MIANPIRLPSGTSTVFSNPRRSVQNLTLGSIRSTCRIGVALVTSTILCSFAGSTMRPANDRSAVPATTIATTRPVAYFTLPPHLVSFRLVEQRIVKPGTVVNYRSDAYGGQREDSEKQPPSGRPEGRVVDDSGSRAPQPAGRGADVRLSGRRRARGAQHPRLGGRVAATDLLLARQADGRRPHHRRRRRRYGGGPRAAGVQNDRSRPAPACRGARGPTLDEGSI